MGRSCSLPCDLTPPFPSDEPHLILFYKDVYGTPIYSFDMRHSADLWLFSSMLLLLWSAKYDMTCQYSKGILFTLLSTYLDLHCVSQVERMALKARETTHCMGNGKME